MKNKKICISQNLFTLRQKFQLTLEEVAEKIGVSRQAVSKWESGETVPDIAHCTALAELYDVSLENLIYFDAEAEGIHIGPKGKHIFGTIHVGERGQIVLPKKARDLLRIKTGDVLVVLGDENPESMGIALVPESYFLGAMDFLKAAMKMNAEDPLDKEDEKNESTRN